MDFQRSFPFSGALAWEGRAPRVELQGPRRVATVGHGRFKGGVAGRTLLGAGKGVARPGTGSPRSLWLGGRCCRVPSDRPWALLRRPYVRHPLPPPPLAFGFQPKSLGGGVAEKMRPRTGRRPLQRVSIDFQPVSLGWKAYSPARGVGRLPLGEGPRRVSSGLRPRRCEQRPRRAHLGPLAGWRRQGPPPFTPFHPPAPPTGGRIKAIGGDIDPFTFSTGRATAMSPPVDPHAPSLGGRFEATGMAARCLPPATGSWLTPWKR